MGVGGAFPLPQGRITATVLSLDAARSSEGAWQSGTLQLETGRAVRFVATGIRTMPVGAVVDVLAVPEVHPTHGPQVRIEECHRVLPPRTGPGLELFLRANVPGLGAARAHTLVSALGLEAIECLNADPAALERLFSGKVGRTLAFSWRKWRERWAADQKAADLALRLVSAGVTYGAARRVVSYFRSAEVAEIIIGKHPYRLLDVPGFAWKRADEIARRLGISRDNPERLEAAAAHALEVAAAEGHSCLPAEVLARRAGHLVQDALLGRQAVPEAVDSATVIEDGGHVYLPQALEAEWVVANHLRRHATVKHPLSTLAGGTVERILSASTLTHEQRQAVSGALTSGLFTLTGGPGTGKTTTVRAIVQAAQALGLRFAIMAPSGKAAARATQVTGAPAGTIHRIIGAAPGNRRDGGPLDLDLLVVDETSMASVEVMSWLLLNLRPSTRLLLCGDPNQLPSVDHGAVLRDVLGAGWVPGIHLTAVHRQAQGSAIVANAYRVLRGEPLTSNRRDFSIARIPEADDPAGQTVADAAFDRLTRAIRWLRDQGADPATDVQVLSPMRRGPLGTARLNAYLQDLLNADGLRGPMIGAGAQVRCGDRVMQVRNDYQLGETGVFNGEQGVVVDLGVAGVVVRFDGERDVEVCDFRLANLQLAWATTIHRSQGSEWPAVITLFHSNHGRMLTRELLYTAATRAKERFVLIADTAATSRMCDPDAPVSSRRCTGLLHHLARSTEPTAHA